VLLLRSDMWNLSPSIDASGSGLACSPTRGASALTALWPGPGRRFRCSRRGFPRFLFLAALRCVSARWACGVASSPTHSAAPERTWLLK